MKSRPLRKFFWVGLSTTLKQMRPLSIPTPQSHENYRLHKWKRTRIFEQQDECSWHGDLGCTAPPSSLSWSGPVSVPLQHQIEEGHSMQIKLCVTYTSWKLGKCWFHCYQTLKCCCYQKSRRTQAQSYITDEGNTSSIFRLLASHFKSRLNLRLYKPSPQSMTQNLFSVIQWPLHRPTTTLALR